MYSSGSTPSSSYNSPSVGTFPIPRDGSSASPPLPGGGIRLPANPLADMGAPRKSHTAPGAGYAYPTPPGTAGGQAGAPGFELRRGSLPVDLTQEPAQWEAPAVAAT